MGALVSVFIGLFGRTSSAIESRDSAGGGDATATGAAGAPSAPEAVPDAARAAAQQAEAEAAKEFGGLLKNPAEWRLKEPEPRIKESRLSAEDRAKLLQHLDRIFDDETLQGRRVIFAPQDIYRLTWLVQPYLESEPMLITDVPFDITVVGDLNGQLHDLHRVFAYEERDGKKGWECMKYIFLGDYVSKGRQALEILMCLFSLKCLYPDRIFLLRGNHEFLDVNSKTGFPLDLWDRYDEKTSEAIYFQINSLFSYLSVAAILGDAYFCAHGGVPLSCWTRRHWRGIQKPYINPKDDVAVYETIWSGPELRDRERNTAVRSDRTRHYNVEMLVVALHSMQCKLLIRSQNELECGYEIIYSICMGICTATGLGPKANSQGAVAIVDARGKITMRILEVDMERVAWERKLKRMDANRDDTDDELLADNIGKGGVKAV